MAYIHKGMSDCKNGEKIRVVSSVSLEVTPAVGVNDSISAFISPDGEQIYDRYCALCHKSGLGGAPIVGPNSEHLSFLLPPQ